MKSQDFILCDVKFLVRLQGKFEIHHSREWRAVKLKGTEVRYKLREKHTHLVHFDTIQWTKIRGNPHGIPQEGDSLLF